jgi:hypothetical protein
MVDALRVSRVDLWLSVDAPGLSTTRDEARQRGEEVAQVCSEAGDVLFDRS